MKTIEEKAKEIAMNNFNKWNDVANVVERDTGYYYELESIIEDTVQIAISEAMRWRDPKEELPDVGKPVVVKYRTAKNAEKHGIGKYFELGIGNPWTIEGSTGREVIGWRAIE